MNDLSQPSPLAAPATDLPEDWLDWSILIVDDEPGMRHFLVKALVPRCLHDLLAAPKRPQNWWPKGMWT